jgi:hypothetical protein
MRIGSNPEKKECKKIEYKIHRIIIPVYIPESNELYYKESLKVFYSCINSLLKTIDVKQTNITIINNNSKEEVHVFINELLQEKKIDKIILNSQNYGKVYAILQEARACYEDIVTILDADVFLFNGWQKEVHKVFGNFKNVGVVGLTPDPHMAFYCNNSLMFNLFYKIKKGKVVENYDLELFEEGISKPNFFRTRKYNWKENQYYILKNGVKVVVGASHFVSSYRKEVFNKIKFEKPIYVFPGGELNFLDIPIDKLGYYRVSLLNAFAYHMGNSIKLDLTNYDFKKSTDISMAKKEEIQIKQDYFYEIKKAFTRLIRKIIFK